MIAMIVWNCAISTRNGSNLCHSVGQIHFLYTKWNLLPHGSLFHIIHGSMNLLSFNPGRHWGITTPTTPARMAGDLSSRHDSGRSHPRHQALRWPCGTCGACLVSAPEKCSMSMWVVWKRQTSRPFKNAMGFWSLFHPLLLGSSVTLSAIIQSSLLVTFGLSSGLWWGSKCHKKHRYSWVLCQKAFATWLF